ncbi:unnamed protein product, partial [Brenthis ino]
MTRPNVRKLLITITIFLSTNEAKILRNNALMTKMVSNFHRDNDLSEQDTEKPEPVYIRMQNVLCKNFPTIPCSMITQDKTLKKLIEKSIQQINSKIVLLEKTTPFPSYLTLFPIVNNEDQSNFDQVLSRYSREKAKSRNNKKHWELVKIVEKSHEKRKKLKNKTKRTSVYGRKKLRKFYPHKVKYRDKIRNPKGDFEDNSGEKLSMSVEVPDMALTKKHQHFSYKLQPVDPPVWRIDYMKHGEPSLNMFGYENDKYKGKIMKTGPNVVVDNVVEGRKDVLHPDVYIKKNLVRKTQDSDGVD